MLCPDFADLLCYVRSSLNKAFFLPCYDTTMNPIRRLRLLQSLSATELAQKASVTDQTIWNLEQGLYIQPPPKVLLALCPGSSVEASSDRMKIKLEYAGWVAQERATTARRLPFIRFPDEAYDTFESYCIAVGGTVRGFCRVIIIQTSVVQGYLDRGSRWDMIQETLRQCGLSPEMLELLASLPRTEQESNIHTQAALS